MVFCGSPYGYLALARFFLDERGHANGRSLYQNFDDRCVRVDGEGGASARPEGRTASCSEARPRTLYNGLIADGSMPVTR